MPPDAKNNIARLYTLLSKLSLESYLSSENFTIFCSKHDLADIWREHVETSRDRPDLYGKDITRNAFILFFDHLFQARPCEFLVILIDFLQDFRNWNAYPLPIDAIKKECTGLGFPDKMVEDEFLKIGM
jgi:hypothetical protein